MSKHKFEAGQLVLARYNVGGGPKWSLQHFSHVNSGDYPFNTITGYSFSQCIPYTTETAHLIGTSDPYEPPKPPHEYKWGDKVEVNFYGDWGIALYIAPTTDREKHWCSTKKRPCHMTAFKISEIRPMEPSHD
ncbi:MULTISPECIES: hypothetical protein [Desulfovibrio]|uniref:Uncharacterized protein n=1 Tax=Desulfovibrio desulfuricans TaxID=876 RepID=A0AA94HRP3_DESDE|nr:MULTISPECIES: hypothetical protein [Desulfovibrio]ATD81119.1 hypothetical protein CNY67_06785 [Desulfovibrio sp. G11]SFW23519.1 hypothetical protein SAMN02910291_00501 [Desulfovibrio desulfuricans]SPD36732.1 Hypothetical protein DSVG11_2698 [Desulfovibrio sp. G11]